MTAPQQQAEETELVVRLRMRDAGEQTDWLRKWLATGTLVVIAGTFCEKHQMGSVVLETVTPTASKPNVEPSANWIECVTKTLASLLQGFALKSFELGVKRQRAMRDN